LIPIGWAAWHPQIGETPDPPAADGTIYECQMDCATNQQFQNKKRNCRCGVTEVASYAIQGTDPGTCTNGDYIDDEECPATFAKYCQPCIGERTMVVYDCTLTACLDDVDTILQTTSNAIKHYGCCESSAIRVCILPKHGLTLLY